MQLHSNIGIQVAVGNQTSLDPLLPARTAHTLEAFHPPNEALVHIEQALPCVRCHEPAGKVELVAASIIVLCGLQRMTEPKNQRHNSRCSGIAVVVSVKYLLVGHQWLISIESTFVVFQLALAVRDKQVGSVTPVVEQQVTTKELTTCLGEARQNVLVILGSWCPHGSTARVHAVLVCHKQRNDGRHDLGQDSSNRSSKSKLL